MAAEVSRRGSPRPRHIKKPHRTCAYATRHGSGESRQRGLARPGHRPCRQYRLVGRSAPSHAHRRQAVVPWRQRRAYSFPRGKANGPFNANVASPTAIYFGPIGRQMPFVKDYPVDNALVTFDKQMTAIWCIFSDSLTSYSFKVAPTNANTGLRSIGLIANLLLISLKLKLKFILSGVDSYKPPLAGGFEHKRRIEIRPCDRCVALLIDDKVTR